MNTVLFDMDGTILDTLTDLQASVNYALDEAGLPRVSRDDTRLAAGYGSIRLIDDLTGHAYSTNSPKFRHVFDTFSQHYAAHSNETTHPYEGVIELMEGLKERGVKMAVVSNKVQAATEALRQLWFGEYITVAVGRMDDVPPKPDPAMAFMALEQLGSAPEDAIFLGDSEPDVQTGKNTGCISVGVTWGFRSREVLEAEEPDYIIDEPAELLAIVDELNASG